MSRKTKTGLDKLLLLYLKFPLGKLDGDKVFDALMEFEDILREIVESENLGNVDGHEFSYGKDEESISFFIYTNDENRLYELVRLLIRHIPCIPGSCVVKSEGAIIPIND